MVKLKYIFKLILSGIVAFSVLCVFAYFYDNTPISAPNPDRYTNSKFLPNRFWCSATEGFSYGTTDSNGFNNLYFGNSFNPEEDADVLILGSSHIQSVNVAQKDNLVYVLNNMFFEDKNSSNDLKCYNIGVSGNFCNSSVSTAKYIHEHFKNLKYIVLEMREPYPEGSYNKFISGKYDSPVAERGFAYNLLQKIPYARTLFHQISGKIKPEKDSDDNAGGKNNANDYLDAFMKKFQEASLKCRAKPIIIFHHSIYPDESGKAVSSTSQEKIDTLKQYCDKYNIEFVNLIPEFIENYKKTYILPHGFSNTSVGKGHLNKTGHYIAAKSLYETITALENKK